jgi:hypothetical protein
VRSLPHLERGGDEVGPGGVFHGNPLGWADRHQQPTQTATLPHLQGIEARDCVETVAKPKAADTPMAVDFVS